MTTRESRNVAHVRIVCVLLLFACSSRANASSNQKETAEALPIVISASMPLYPMPAWMAGIEGVVRLRISTDGRRVSTVLVESGPPMLAPATEQNVRTWQFKDHAPTSFVATFRYKLRHAEKCYLENGTAVLNLPTDVEVSAKRVLTCDPVSERQQ